MGRDPDPEPVCARCGHYFVSHRDSRRECTVRVESQPPWETTWQCPCKKPLDVMPEDDPYS